MGGIRARRTSDRQPPGVSRAHRGGAVACGAAVAVTKVIISLSLALYIGLTVDTL